MKTMLGFLIAWAALCAGVVAQQLSPHSVPARVNESFHSKFKGVRKVEWKRKSDQNYEAEFKLNGVEVAAKFDQRGKWLENETTIEQSALTTDIRRTISTNYKDFKIIETQKVEGADDKPVLYEVHLDNAEEILKLQFESNGTVSSKSAKRKRPVTVPVGKPGDLYISISLTITEHGRDSSSTKTTFMISGNKIVGEETYGGYRAAQRAPVHKEYVLTAQEIGNLKRLIQQKNLLRSRSLASPLVNGPYTSYDLKEQIKWQGKMSLIKVSGPINSVNSNRVKTSRVYQDADALLEYVKATVNLKY